MLKALFSTIKICMIALLAFPLLASPAAMASTSEIRVSIDETAPFSFDEDVATIAITNPMIADATIHNGRNVLVVGRTFGVTNIIALNAAGQPIGIKRVRVTSPGPSGSLTLVLGNQPWTYSCAPDCRRMLLPGEDHAAFERMQKEYGDRQKLIENAAD